MFFKKKRNKLTSTNPNVAAVHRIVAVFVIVTLFYNLVKHHTILPGQNIPEIKASIVKAAPSIPSGYTNIKNYFPPEPLVATIKDTQPGAGEPAVCGQDVTIAYTTATETGKPLPDSTEKDSPLTFRIGEHKVMPALEQGVVDMKKGGKRNISSPAGLAYDSKGFSRKDVPKNTTVVFNMELLDIKPTLPDLKDTPFHISTLQRGSGHPILCGDTAKVRVTVWDTAGKKLFTTHDNDDKPLVFTTGKSEVFLGLEQGVIGMNMKEKRSLIVPPAFQKTMRGNAPEVKIPFPTNQTVLVDVESVP